MTNLILQVASVFEPRSYPSQGKVRLHTLLGDNPSTRSLKDGTLKSELLSFDFDDSFKITHDGFKPMVRDGRFDCGELAIVTYLQARALGRPLLLLPAPIGGRFQHHTLAHDASRGTLLPQGLAGKRIGIRSYTQTTVTWVRGILRTEYGVSPEDVHWVAQEDAHMAEYSEPDNVSRVEDRPLSQLLLDGDVDAAILGNKKPDDPRLQPVIADPEAAATDWHRRTGIVPINHIFVVRADLSRQRPDVIRALYDLLLESRDRDIPSERGRQMRPFTLAALLPSLEAIIDFALFDGLIDRRLSVGDLFDETTAALGA